MADDIVTRLRAYDIGNVAHESCYHMTEVLGEAADEIERLRAENQMLNEALAHKGTKQVAKIVSTTSSCDEWMLPIFAKDNRHLCDACNGEKYHHSYEWVPAITPFGGSCRAWPIDQINRWYEEGKIDEDRYHVLANFAMDEEIAVRGE